MVLIGSLSVLNKTPGRWVTGSAQAQNRSNWNNPGSIRNAWVGWAGLSFAQSHPAGYDIEYSIYDCPRTGGISSRNNVTGSGNTANVNMAAGLYLGQTFPDTVCYLVGNSLESMVGKMVIYTTSPSTATGSGNVSAATLAGSLLGSAAITGSSANTANLLSAAQLTAILTASGNATGTAEAILAAIAAITGTTTVSADCYSLIIAVAAITGSSSLSANILAKGLLAAAAAGSGNLTAASTGVATFIAAVLGSGGVSSSTAVARAYMSSTVNVTGDLLTTANVGPSVWDYLIEAGFSAQDIMKITAAVAAGKTDINTAGPSPVVTFRDLDDTKDVVTATMTGSERTSVALDP